MNLNKLLTFFPWIIIIILGLFLIFRSPQPISEAQEIKYKDSIQALQESIAKKDGTIILNKQVIDSLNQVKSTNKIKYVKDIQFIDRPNTTVSDLDSIIRKLSGIK